MLHRNNGLAQDNAHNCKVEETKSEGRPWQKPGLINARQKNKKKIAPMVSDVPVYGNKLKKQVPAACQKLRNASEIT
ncbi:unnamed protein product, partial [Brenthis ino]